MNYSLLRSDRGTHLKIGITAVLATALVIAIGISAQPPRAAPRLAVHSVDTPAMAGKVDRVVAATH